MDIITRAEMLEFLGLPLEPVDPTLKRLSGLAREMYLESLPPPARYFVIDSVARLFLEVDGPGARMEFAEEFQRTWARVGDDQPALIDCWMRKGGECPII